MKKIIISFYSAFIFYLSCVVSSLLFLIIFGLFSRGIGEIGASDFLLIMGSSISYMCLGGIIAIIPASLYIQDNTKLSSCVIAIVGAITGILLSLIIIISSIFSFDVYRYWFPIGFGHLYIILQTLFLVWIVTKLIRSKKMK